MPSRIPHPDVMTQARTALPASLPSPARHNAKKKNTFADRAHHTCAGAKMCDVSKASEEGTAIPHRTTSIVPQTQDSSGVARLSFQATRAHPSQTSHCPSSATPMPTGVHAPTDHAHAAIPVRHHARSEPRHQVRIPRPRPKGDGRGKGRRRRARGWAEGVDAYGGRPLLPPAIRGAGALSAQADTRALSFFTPSSGATQSGSGGHFPHHNPKLRTIQIVKTTQIMAFRGSGNGRRRDSPAGRHFGRIPTRRASIRV